MARHALIAPLALTVVLAGCCKPEVITRPVPVETVRLVVQPIPAELLRDHPVATGPLAECPKVAAARRAEIDACNADKRALRDMGKD